MSQPRRSDYLAAHLRNAITSGVIPAGQKLPSESALITEHGVSRTVVREALGRLHAEGLITTRRGLGSFALSPAPGPPAPSVRPVRSLSDRVDLIGYRLALESETAALAAAEVATGHITDHQLAGLRAEHEAFTQAAQHPILAIRHDFAFHRGVAALSGNPYFLDALDALGPVMISMPRTRLEAAGAGQEHRHEAAALEHRHILCAVTEGDPAGAAAAVRTHLTNSRRRVRADMQ